MGHNPLRPVFYRPDTLVEAVQMLTEYGQRACVIGGIESPPPGKLKPEVFINISGLVEMAGIHQLGGRVTLGANTPHNVIARATLVRTNGTCLAEACEGANYPSTSLLLYDLRPDADFSPALLALSALDAEVESAWLDSSGLVGRIWSSLDTLWSPAISWDSRLPLTVRFAVDGTANGSAMIFATPPPGTSAHIIAAAAHLSLDVSKSAISDVKVVLAPKEGRPFASPGAASLLRNHPPDPNQIEQAAHAALLDAQAYLGPLPPEAAYRIDLAAHLTRQALDRSLARALREPLSDRL